MISLKPIAVKVALARQVAINVNDFRAPLTTIDRSIFRAYDIRGTVPDTLDTQKIYWLGRAIAARIKKDNASPCVVGTDGRISGPLLKHALICGIRESGVDVIDIGFAPTPLINFLACQQNEANAVAVTASHNPGDQNGLKVMIGHNALMDDEIDSLADEMFQVTTTGAGRLNEQDQSAHYVHQLAQRFALNNDWRVVIDGGNGIGGPLALKTFKRLGVQAIPLFIEVDGHFPHHAPDPCVEANLAALKQAVTHYKADLGIALDGDGDRVVILDHLGQTLPADRLLVLLAQSVLEKEPGALILNDAKCSSIVADQVKALGGKIQMGRTGHSPMKRLLRSSGAQLAGELSAHYYFADWYGFDDGVHTAVRLMQRLEELNLTLAELAASLPIRFTSPEFRINLTPSQYDNLVMNLGSIDLPDSTIDRTDGVRCTFTQGWALARLSNTESALVLRYEGLDAQSLNHVARCFNATLTALDSSLVLPDESALNS